MSIKEISTESLNDFWYILSPLNDFIGRITKPIFRGHGDSKWFLTPSILRKCIVSKYKNSSVRDTPIDHIVIFEYLLLRDFLDFCDEAGLAIPQDSAAFRKIMNVEEFTNRYGEDGIRWPAEEYFSFIALAQHHGIPTRLLDWTRSSYVAAYFAASQALNIDLKGTPQNLSVLVIDSAMLYHLREKSELVSVCP